MGNFDLVNILTHVWCGAPVRPNMFEHSNVSAVNTEGKEIGIGWMHDSVKLVSLDAFITQLSSECQSCYTGLDRSKRAH